MTEEKLLKSVIENALDFLSKAIDDFNISLKYSIINFHTSIELFLKARLMSEHWSLVVSKKKEPDLDDFLNGDFESVTFVECLSKLKKVVKITISDEFEKSITAITKHRNKTVHFFHDAHTPEADQRRKAAIAKEQLRCWYHMHLFLESEAKLFGNWASEIERIERKFKVQREYLQIVYDGMEPKINEFIEKGNKVKLCPSCGFSAMTNSTEINSVQENECFVCNVIETSLVIECPHCQTEVAFFNEGYATCNNCNNEFDPDKLASILHDEKFLPGDIVDSLDLLGNCSECDGYETVAPSPDGGYICTSCFETFDNLEVCDWCGIPNTSDMSFTGIQGCNFCDGSSNYE
ncbi:hypothetical protein FH587_02205 (plasmid) [Leptospira interrogans]|uniref:hypothetical protein n=1 Tax=Leptospira interrogans TaxID=173 RepID=UPI001F074823|nr:hypothetical protein [Leptospira interrogans]UML82795.1 hypothetical protein FH587_02205 [Leptospira interrogans]